MAKFNPNNTFGQRILENREEKQKVAWYVTEKWLTQINDRADAFITDGSSTFYICPAILAISRKRLIHICTNNLAFSSEVDAHADQDVREKLKLELLGGEKDFDLNATLGHQAEEYANDFLGRHNLVITSIRELHPELGPTAPEVESRCLKKVAMEKANLLIIITDWQKLATPPINNTNRVFSCSNDWKELLMNKEVWIISAMPSNTNKTEEAQALLTVKDTYELGRKLKASDKAKDPVAWMKPHEKYAFNVYRLSEDYHVNFVEIG
jgi:hypothetical protein